MSPFSINFVMVKPKLKVFVVPKFMMFLRTMVRDTGS